MYILFLSLLHVHTPIFLILATNKFAQVQTIEVEILILSYNIT